MPSSFEVFQWHGETFTIPKGAERLLESAFCANQAFLLNNLHLGLQCHIEMTSPMIEAWCAVGTEEIQMASSSPAVQQPQAMQESIGSHVTALHRVADILYGKWVRGLKH